MISKHSRQVFLSYTKKQRRLADAVAQKLRDHQLEVWDAYSMPVGSPVEDAIREALKASDSMIAILDPYAFSSSRVREELEYALFDERYKGRLLSVFVGAKKEDFARLPWILNRLELLRFRESKNINRQATKIADTFLRLLRSSEAK